MNMLCRQARASCIPSPVVVAGIAVTREEAMNPNSWSSAGGLMLPVHRLLTTMVDFDFSGTAWGSNTYNPPSSDLRTDVLDLGGSQWISMDLLDLLGCLGTRLRPLHWRIQALVTWAALRAVSSQLLTFSQCALLMIFLSYILRAHAA
jgi:hypothetical protein